METLEQERTTAGGRAHVVHCESPADVGAILQPGVNLALVPREIPTLHVRSGFDEGANTGSLTPDFRVKVSSIEDRDLGKALSKLVLHFNQETAAWLSEDILGWTRQFLALVSPEPVRVWLEQVSRDHCRAFHVDALTLRLLCTYRGPGTQWLANEAVETLRDGRRLRGDLLGVETHALETGWVGLLKGERFPGNGGNGIVHRSPPLRPGESRLLLRLDAGFPAHPPKRDHAKGERSRP